MKPILLLLLIILLGSCSADKDWIVLDSGITDGLHDIEPIDKKTALTYTYGLRERADC